MITTSQAWKDYSRDVGIFHIKAVMDNDTTENLLFTTPLHDEYIILPDGSIVSGQGQYHTDFIAVEDGGQYNASLVTVFLYSSSFTLLDSFDISDNHFTATVEGNTVAYVRFNGILSTKANDYVRERNFLELTDEDFMMGSVSITDSISDLYDFKVGSVITNSFNATLNNFNGKFNSYLLAGATIAVQFGIVFDDETEEWIDRGIYTLEKPTSLGSTIKIVGYDGMDKLNKYFDNQTGCPNFFNKRDAIKNIYVRYDGSTTSDENWFATASIPVANNHSYKTNMVEKTDPNNPPYVVCYDTNGVYLGYVPIVDGVFSTYISGETVGYICCNGLISNIENSYIIDFNDNYYIHYPTNAKEILKSVCNRCGVPYIVPSDWTNGSPTIRGFEINESTTCRQVLGWVMEICGMYARINPNGYMECKKFKRNEWSVGESINGGSINPWSSVSSINGGTISPWSAVTDYAGGESGNIDFTLSKIKSLDVYIEDIVITGVTAIAYNTVNQFESYTYGDYDYTIKIQDNPLIDDWYQPPSIVAKRVGEILVGTSVRPFTASIIGDPSIEAGDIVLLQDYLGEVHDSLITSLTYSVNQAERIECSINEHGETEWSNQQTQTVSQAVSATKDDMSANGINVNNNATIEPDGALSATSITIDGEPVADFVVEEGISGAWTYRKWNSGIAECWINNYSLGSCAITSAYGNAFYIAKSDYAFPTSLFVSAPQVSVSTLCSLGLLSASVYEVTASKYSFYLWDTQSETLTVSISVRAIGEWK